MNIVDIKFEQLTNNSQLSNDDLNNIAQLVYHTDPYIYPALFDNSDNAKKIIPLLILNNDDMFKKENFFVAIYMHKIVGIILWKKGSISCDLKLYKKLFAQYSIELPKNFYFTFDTYFSEYKNLNMQNISILNVCIDKQYRGHRIGSLLMKCFLENHKKNNIELYVLKNNINAINLYKKNGFKIISELNGFSVTKEKPICYKMLREKSR
ncbi:GNAT family N-acetyltransferase [[Clostridium] spiroforme]|nr:GNAT family N-acetyltransferase [Thomasclavelia spiroformis]MBM6879519.1 GNAT family N-acetyltransferase [Thomasclavelia spiroformis]